EPRREDWRRDDDEPRASGRLLGGADGLVDCAELLRALHRLARAGCAHDLDVAQPGAVQREADRAADEAESDDRDALHVSPSSTTAQASSAACNSARRGSASACSCSLIIRT